LPSAYWFLAVHSEQRAHTLSESSFLPTIRTRSRRLRAEATALSLALCACNFAPKYVQPELPVPLEYSEVSPGAQSIATLGWHDFFRDEVLRSLIASAIANNRDIRIAAARVLQARGQWRVQGASLYPQLDALGAGIKGNGSDDFQPDIPLSGVNVPDKLVTANLAVGWEPDFWGRLRNLKDAARERFLATEEARRAVAIDLIAQVSNGYLLEREYGDRIAIANQTVATRQESYRIMRRRFEVGYGNNLEAQQARMLLNQAQSSLESLVQERGTNRNALALLVGQPVQIPPGKLQMVEGVDSIPVGLPSDLLVNRPDIVEAEFKLRAANADIGAARAAFFPSISLTGSVGSASTALDSLFSGGSGSWLFAPLIRLPIFTGGRLKGNLDVARARQVEAVADYEQTIQQAFRDVSDALVKRKQLGLRIETTREMLGAAEVRARLAQMRYEAGSSTYLEVLDAQRDLFDTQQSLVGLERAYLSTAVELYRALGGGFARNAALAGTVSQLRKQAND
jgi:NodT family efflux transporter outer membrane factor (OMF) lipoprotein